MYTEVEKSTKQWQSLKRKEHNKELLDRKVWKLAKESTHSVPLHFLYIHGYNVYTSTAVV